MYLLYSTWYNTIEVAGAMSQGIPGTTFPYPGIVKCIHSFPFISEHMLILGQRPPANRNISIVAVLTWESSLLSKSPAWSTCAINNHQQYQNLFVSFRIYQHSSKISESIHIYHRFFWISWFPISQSNRHSCPSGDEEWMRDGLPRAEPCQMSELHQARVCCIARVCCWPWSQSQISMG